MWDRPLSILALLLISSTTLRAQTVLEARPEDVDSPEAIVRASYEALERSPGENFDWDRYRTLFLPEAILIPNTEQRQGSFDVLTVEQFIDWIDGWYAVNVPIGGPTDRGFAEEEVAARIERFGDVAQVFSTYRKHLYDDDHVLGRGINSFQLVHQDGRWWIAAVAWDEESGAGPLPAEYLPAEAGE